MAVTLELALNGTTLPRGRYVGWAPAPARLRVVDPDGAVDPIPVRLDSPGRAAAGWSSPRSATPRRPTSWPGPARPTARRSTSGCSVGSRARAGPTATPGSPCCRPPGDAAADRAADGAGPQGCPDPDLGRAQPLPQRAGPAQQRGLGAYQSYRDMHTDDTNDEAHSRDAFLPWHRAYLLDLERELQAIDPSVTVPYWRFDQPAPRVFSRYLHGPDRVRGGRGGLHPEQSAEPVRHRRAAGHRPAALLRHPDEAAAQLQRAGGGRAAGRPVPAALHPAPPTAGEQPARPGAHQLHRRLHQPDRDGGTRPAVLPAARQRRPALGEVAVVQPAVRPGRPEQLLLPRPPAGTPGADTDRPQRPGHHVAVERRADRPAARRPHRVRRSRVLRWPPRPGRRRPWDR